MQERTAKAVLGLGFAAMMAASFARDLAPGAGFEALIVAAGAVTSLLLTAMLFSPLDR